MKDINGFSLVELIVIITIMAVLAYITVPKLQYAAIIQQDAEAVARKLVTDLRRTRSIAILNAADNTDGYGLNMTGSSPYSGYQIVDLSDSSVVDTHNIGSGVSCTGGSQFQYGPLGNLKAGSDTQLSISAGNKTFNLTIVSATGMVKYVEN